MPERKPRLVKKLCKKAAQVINFDNCVVEEGVWWYLRYGCDGEVEDYLAWDWLTIIFDGTVNVDKQNFEWLPEDQRTKATVVNVLAWAKEAIL